MKMTSLKKRIESELGIPTFDPPNGETVYIKTERKVPIALAFDLVQKFYLQEQNNLDPKFKDGEKLDSIRPIKSISIEGNPKTSNKILKGRFVRLLDTSLVQKVSWKIYSRKFNPFPLFQKGFISEENVKSDTLGIITKALDDAAFGHDKMGDQELMVGSDIRISLSEALDDFSFQISWDPMAQDKVVKVLSAVNAYLS